jgi:hypothetical protein
LWQHKNPSYEYKSAICGITCGTTDTQGEAKPPEPINDQNSAGVINYYYLSVDIQINAW